MLGKWLKSAQPDPPHASLLQQGLQSRIVPAKQFQSEKLFEVDGTARRSNEAQGLLQKDAKPSKSRKYPKMRTPKATTRLGNKTVVDKDRKFHCVRGIFVQP